MGSCVSLHKDPESALKLRLDFGSKTDKLVNPSPDKHSNLVAADAVFKSHWSPAPPVTATRDFGSKEESFFDSRPWLDSDCEDDFFSVNGDFTPSRGNTPVHERIAGVRTPGVGGSNGQIFGDRSCNSNNGMSAEPSPTMKKKLSELFKDAVESEQEDAGEKQEQKGGGGGDFGSLKSGNSTPYVVNSGGSQRSPNSDSKPPMEKSVKPVQCCLPRLRSFRERKRS